MVVGIITGIIIPRCYGLKEPIILWAHNESTHRTGSIMVVGILYNRYHTLEKSAKNLGVHSFYGVPLQVVSYGGLFDCMQFD